MTMEGMKDKLIDTAIIYFLFLQLAIRFGILGPTLIDLEHSLHVRQEDMSIMFAITSAGICVGALLSGFLYKFIARQIALSIILIANGLLVGVLTYITDFRVFVVCQFIIGAASGSAVSGCEAWILEIWADKCAPYMQALQFFRGLGYIIGPILVQPFLAPETTRFEPNAHFNHTVNVNLENQTIYNNTDYNYDHESVVESKTRIQIPYLINGALLTAGGLITIISYIVRLGTSRLSASKSNMLAIGSQATIVNSISVSTIESALDIDINPSADKLKVSKLYSAWIVFLCSIFYLFYFEEVVVTYLASFATNIDLHLSKSEGAFLSSAFNLANIVAKAVNIFLALKISPLAMLYADLSVTVLSLSLLLFYANTSTVLLWTLVCLLGIGLSSIIGSLYALMESAIEMNALICGVFNMSGTLGSVFTPLIMAPFIEAYPLVLIDASFVSAICCLLVLLGVHLSIKSRSKNVTLKE